MISAPLRLGLAGISHDHVSILSQLSSRDFDLVGVFERDPLLLETFGNHLNIPEEARFTDLNAMLTASRPHGVAAFGSIYDHLAVVEACAPLGIHVMVEKPLAVGVEHAERMAGLAASHGIHLLTNYETTWYPSTERAFTCISEGVLGRTRKVLVRDGHGGPVETGCQPQFLSWLTDPLLSGGGALSDFGCYGANLLTRLMGGKLPRKVTAVTRTFKPDVYPLVEDDALIVLSYDDVEGVIQASWNWPFPRKDIEIFGTEGSLFAADARSVLLRRRSDVQPRTLEVPPLARTRAEPFAYFAAVVRGEEVVAPHDLPALVNNLAVVRILAAAQRSASTGQTISL